MLLFLLGRDVTEPTDIRTNRHREQIAMWPWVCVCGGGGVVGVDVGVGVGGVVCVVGVVCVRYMLRQSWAHIHGMTCNNTLIHYEVFHPLASCPAPLT